MIRPDEELNKRSLKRRQNRNNFTFSPHTHYNNIIIQTLIYTTKYITFFFIKRPPLSSGSVVVRLRNF